MSAPPLIRRFTVDEYHRMAEAGILHEDDRVELLDGQIVEMTPIRPEHAGCVDDLARWFTQRLGASAVVRVQNPMRLGTHVEPQPDIAVVKPRREGYRTEHPGPDDVLLIIEVADTSLERDRDLKLPLYAQALIPEVWLVNLPGDNIQVCREPRAGSYAETRTARRGESLTPLLLPGTTLPVDDILG